MRPLTRLAWLLVAVAGLGCAATQSEVVERVSQGPKGEELFLLRTYLANGRAPNFDERRMWQDRIDERVSRYLREHPELERAERYSDFRFWRQVSVGATRDEVRTLLEEPDEETIDPALMGALAKRHWEGIQKRAAEAWLYPVSWVIFFDDKGTVVEMVRRVGRFSPSD